MTRLPVTADPEDLRTLSAEPEPFPVRICGYQVIAAALVPSRHGHAPDVAFMVLRDVSRPVLRQYSTVTARAERGQWSAGDGSHDCSYAKAMEIFMERINYGI